MNIHMLMKLIFILLVEIGKYYIVGIKILENDIRLNIGEICSMYNIKNFIIVFSLINIVDIAVWCGLVGMGIHYTLFESIDTIKLFSDIDILFWIILFFIMSYVSKKNNTDFNKLSFVQQILSIIVFSLTAISVGCLNFALEVAGLEISYKNKFVVEICLLVVLFILGLKIYSNILKKTIKGISNKFQEESLRIQIEYYKELIKSNEELRSFRHDLNKHFQIIQLYCEQKRYEQITEYIRNIDNNIRTFNKVYTRNPIADYFIEKYLREMKLKNNLNFIVIGTFPEKLPINDEDFCVLFSNAIENAINELKNVDNKKTLIIEIKNYDGHMFLLIKNSYKNINIKLITTKKDKQFHGYGIKNMKKIVAKYNGEIYIEQKELFELNIKI